jgi:hypothetical protein
MLQNILKWSRMVQNSPEWSHKTQNSWKESKWSDMVGTHGGRSGVLGEAGLRS